MIHELGRGRDDCENAAYHFDYVHVLTAARLHAAPLRSSHFSDKSRLYRRERHYPLLYPAETEGRSVCHGRTRRYISPVSTSRDEWRQIETWFTSALEGDAR